MSIPQPQLDRLQVFLDKIMADLEPAQEAYFAAHGRYFQFLPTHTERVPGERKSDRLDIRPSDQAESIKDVLGNKWNALSFVANVRCDVYVSNEGHGWMLVFEVDDEERGEPHQRVIARGPLADRLERDWEKVDPVEVI